MRSSRPHALVAALLAALLVPACFPTGPILREPRPNAPNVSADRREARAAMEQDAARIVAELRAWQSGLSDAAAGRRVSHARDIVHAARNGVAYFTIRHSGARRDAPDLLWDIQNASLEAVRALQPYAEQLAASGRLQAAIGVLDAARGVRAAWKPSEEGELMRTLNGWRSQSKVRAEAERAALAACEAGAPTAAQYVRDGAPGSGTPKLDLKLPDRCEGAVGSVALRVRPTAIDAGLRAAVEPLVQAGKLVWADDGAWSFTAELQWGKPERRVEDGSSSVEVQVGTKVGPNPELASCQSRLRDAESKVQRERSALNSARNASSQARATRVAALRSAEEDVVRTRKRCSSMPSTAKVPVMESKSYPTKTQILEVELKVTLTLQPTEGKPLKASGTIRPRVLSVRHAAHPALGVRAMNAAPPTEAELRERVYSDLAEHVGKLVAKGIRRSARSLRAEVEQARDGACMAHAEKALRLLRASPALFETLRKNEKGLIESQRFDDLTAAKECLGLPVRLH